MAHALLSGPSKDDGYDITDFYGVDSRFGSHGDFVELVRTARAHGIRVILDFVMNHTSDQHPWFKSAGGASDDPYRDYFVWSRTKPKTNPKDIVFPDQEDSLWELEPTDRRVLPAPLLQAPAGPQRPQPQVQEEIARTLGFWLELGSPGSGSTRCRSSSRRTPRPEGSEGTTVSFDPKRYLGDVRKYVTRRLGDAVLLGEVNLPYPEMKKYFGGAQTATGSTCSSTSRGCRRSTCPWLARTRARSRRRCASARRSTSPASGPTSSATTTS